MKNSGMMDHIHTQLCNQSLYVFHINQVLAGDGI
jgi:hypothetical protein